ncbi:MAG: DNA alkylation repair protein, partial [Clostridia bacterium]|nr:DNA alkylation repair protein [Clostridia bacterium]
ALAKEIYKSGDYEEFIVSLPHKYYEEDNLHGFIISQIKNYDECIDELHRFIPFIDNWATCDGTRPRVLKQRPQETLAFALKLLEKESTYTVRYGIGLLHSFYLGEHFDVNQLKIVAQIKSEEYYINMMIAWYFATALTRQYESTVPYIEERLLSPWVHNKTIQKANESLCIKKEKKDYLKSLKFRNG